MIHFDPFAWIYENNRQHDPARNHSRDRIDYRNIRCSGSRMSGATTMTKINHTIYEAMLAKIERLETELEACKKIVDAVQTPDSQATAEVKKLREELRSNGIIR